MIIVHIVSATVVPRLCSCEEEQSHDRLKYKQIEITSFLKSPGQASREKSFSKTLSAKRSRICSGSSVNTITNPDMSLASVCPETNSESALPCEMDESTSLLRSPGQASREKSFSKTLSAKRSRICSGSSVNTITNSDVSLASVCPEMNSESVLPCEMDESASSSNCTNVTPMKRQRRYLSVTPVNTKLKDTRSRSVNLPMLQHQKKKVARSCAAVPWYLDPELTPIIDLIKAESKTSTSLRKRKRNSLK